MALTEQQKKARSEKAAATRKRKLEATAKAMGIDKDLKRKKIRKTRKPMSAEQKAAAVERLKKAREARAPAASSTYPAHIANLPDDALLSIPKVRQWIKKCGEELRAMRGWDVSKEAAQRAAYQDLETYISNMNSYLRVGEWLDFRYGENREGRITRKCLTLAYDKYGNVKRTVGTFYDDLGMVWTKEMDIIERERLSKQK